MRICICISVLACCLSSARSQDLSRGRVLDSADRSAVPYVSIGIEGKNVGTMSDAEGNFVLPVADAAGNADTLLFSCVGYAPENSRIGDRFFSGILLRFEAERQPDSRNRSPYFPKPTYENRTKQDRDRSAVGRDRLFQLSGASRRRVRHAAQQSVQKLRTVNRLSFFVRKNGFESASFRLTFYSAENGLPKDILAIRTFVSIPTAIRAGSIST